MLSKSTILLLCFTFSVLRGASAFVTPMQLALGTASQHGGKFDSSVGSKLDAFSPVQMIATTLRGGATEAVFDLGRESLKLQSMATYSTITALVMNASLRLYTSQKFQTEVGENGKRPKGVRTLEGVFTGSTVLCIVSGMFTAVLFNVLGIYSKEALGMRNESGYLAFAAATAIYRKWGFRAFLTTCISFIISFVTSVVEKTSNEDRAGQLILISSIIALIFGAFHIQTVLALATKLIYTPEFVSLNDVA